jgi:hypothetical protein
MVDLRFDHFQFSRCDSRLRLMSTPPARPAQLQSMRAVDCWQKFAVVTVVWHSRILHDMFISYHDISWYYVILCPQMEVDGSHRFSMVSPGRKYTFHRLEPPPQVLTLGFSGVPPLPGGKRNSVLPVAGNGNVVTPQCPVPVRLVNWESLRKRPSDCPRTVQIKVQQLEIKPCSSVVTVCYHQSGALLLTEALDHCNMAKYNGWFAMIRMSVTVSGSKPSSQFTSRINRNRIGFCAPPLRRAYHPISPKQNASNPNLQIFDRNPT